MGINFWRSNEADIGWMAEIVIRPLLPKGRDVDLHAIEFAFDGTESSECVIGVREKLFLLLRGRGSREIPIIWAQVQQKVATCTPDDIQSVTVFFKTLAIAFKNRGIHKRNDNTKSAPLGALRVKWGPLTEAFL